MSGWGVSGLTVRYGRRTALHDVTLDVPAGAVTAVIGGDGAGKTTLLRALAGVARPTAGTVHSPARRRIGYVAGASGLYDDLTVAENVAFVAGAYGVRGAELEARLAELLERTGLDGVGERLAGPHLEVDAGDGREPAEAAHDVAGGGLGRRGRGMRGAA